jgi:hypothetical protein
MKKKKKKYFFNFSENSFGYLIYMSHLVSQTPKSVLLHGKNTLFCHFFAFSR